MDKAILSVPQGALQGKRALALIPDRFFNAFDPSTGVFTLDVRQLRAEGYETVLHVHEASEVDNVTVRPWRGPYALLEVF
jgi:hypothetical protein